MTTTENNDSENPFAEIDAVTDKRKPFRRRILIPLIVALVIGSPFLYRASRLWKLPDIGEPFDVQEFTSYKPADDENAFTYYALVKDRRTPDPKLTTVKTLANGYEMTHLSLSFDQVLESNTTDFPYRKEWESWIAENDDVLQAWKQGSEKTESLHILPAEMHVATLLPVIDEMHSIARLVVVKAKQLADDGKLDEAWELYRALFRCSRHLGQHSFVIDRHVGIAHYHQTCRAVLNHWARQPGITDKQLATAIQQLTDINEMTPPLADGFKTEYLMYMNTLSRSDWTLRISEQIEGGSTEDIFGPLNLWLQNEPEFTRRLLKLYFAEAVFSVETSRQQTKGQQPVGPIEKLGLSGKRLERLSKSSALGKAFPRAYTHFYTSDGADRARQVMLISLLSAYRFKLANGRFPKTIGELQTAYPEISLTDPNGQQKAQPLRYKINGNRLIVWSVGHDGADNGGQIDDGNTHGTDVGYEIKLKPDGTPAENASEN